LIAIAVSTGAQAWTMKVLHDFCSMGPCNQSFSYARLLVDGAGNLYGTRENDGSMGLGTVYKLSFDSVSDNWTFAVLHDFCTAANCTDGSTPSGSLIIDVKGNLYGTAYKGGSTNHGLVYELTAKGKFKVLYSFCPDGQTCADGGYPSGALTYAGAVSGVPYDGVSPLYGTMGINSTGEIFELTPGERSKWNEANIFNFGSEFCYSDGVSLDVSGNLFGATEYCGDDNAGMAFVLSPGDEGWVRTAQFSFCFSCYEGNTVKGTLLKDDNGNLYGATEFGGLYGMGTLFRLTPAGDSFKLKTLRSLKPKDGTWPTGGLTMDASGNLFGTTYGQGRGRAASVFEVSGGTTFHVIYSFCLKDGCAAGARPLAGLALDKAGNLYGTTPLGGAYGFGTVFELSP